MNEVLFGKFDIADYGECLIVTDAHIARLYGISGDNVFLLPRGEEAKDFANVRALCSWFLAKRLSPQGRVVAVGGGSIGDTVGFACSIFKRGVKLLHVPTTLVAMTDSAIGGKTAIDLDGVKNAVGTYCFADTLVDVGFLDTLDCEQMASGRGEIFKYRMLSDRIDGVYNGGKCDMADIVEACARYKSEVCAEDPYCGGVRNKLNFGHTLGHAMELTLSLPHGIAVANGMYYETELARKLGLCSARYAAKWRSEIGDNFKIYPFTEPMFALTLNDKKNGADGRVAFALPSSFDTVRVPLADVVKLLA